MSDAMILSPAEYVSLKPMLYHRVTPETSLQMAQLRAQYVATGLAILRSPPPPPVQALAVLGLQNAPRSTVLALMHLEDSLMRAIQGLAMSGEPVLPLGIQIRKSQATTEGPHDQPSR